MSAFVPHRKRDEKKTSGRNRTVEGKEEKTEKAPGLYARVKQDAGLLALA